MAASLLTAPILFDAIAAARYLFGLDAKFDGLEIKRGFRGVMKIDTSPSVSSNEKIVVYVLCFVVIIAIVGFSGPARICALSATLLSQH